MATFTVILGDPETGTSHEFTLEGQAANRFLGREIGDTVDGDVLDLPGYEIEITGGSDTAGRPMREDVSGPNLSELLLEGGVGFNPERDGQRRRITVRGREISENIAQINSVVASAGEESIATLLGEDDEEEDVDEDNEE